MRTGSSVVISIDIVLREVTSLHILDGWLLVYLMTLLQLQWLYRCYVSVVVLNRTVALKDPTKQKLRPYQYVFIFHGIYMAACDIFNFIS